MRVTFGEATQDSAGHWVVAVQRLHDDGTVQDGVHVFPADILEWRAAEYDVDPADTTTLLDIVLAEPYLTEEDHNTGSRLHDVGTVDGARADHLARCAKVKLRHRMTTRGAKHPLDKIRREAVLHPDALAIKRELVRRSREEHRRQSTVDPEQARLSALRDRLRESS